MRKRIEQPLKAGLVALVMFLGMAGLTLAETRTSGGITASTYADGDTYKAQHTSSFSRYWMQVIIRPWGEAPQPLKDQDYDDTYYPNTFVRTPDGVWNGYHGIYSSQHLWQDYGGGPVYAIYTSPHGCNSSYCWFANGTTGSCPGTC